MTTLVGRPVLSDAAKFLYEKVGFVPHDEQLPILASSKRFILVSGGEQSGKSYTAAKYLLARLAEVPKGLYWLVGSDYDNTSREFHYLVDDLSAVGLLKNASKRVDPGFIELKGGTLIKTKSAKDTRKLAQEAPNGIVMCEASQCDLTTFNKCRSRAAPNRGWLFLAGTMEGSLGWYPGLITAWRHGLEDRKSYSLPTWTNIALYPGGRNDPEILALEREASDDFFMERIAGEPVPPRGLVFPQFRPDIHVDFECEYVKGEPVHLWVDPGYAHAHAVLAVQFIDGQVRIFDEVYERGLITEDIIRIVKQRKWQRDVKFGVIDVGGMQHQAMAAPAEVWLSPPRDDGGGGMSLYMNYQKVPINDGIERVKSYLMLDPVHNRPKLLVSPSCLGILSEFGVVPFPLEGPGHGETRAYRWKQDKDGNVVGDVPEDKHNDALKALVYGLVDNFGYVRVTNQEQIKVKRWR